MQMSTPNYAGMDSSFDNIINDPDFVIDDHELDQLLSQSDSGDLMQLDNSEQLGGQTDQSGESSQHQFAPLLHQWDVPMLPNQPLEPLESPMEPLEPPPLQLVHTQIAIDQKVLEGKAIMASIFNQEVSMGTLCYHEVFMLFTYVMHFTDVSLMFH